MKSPACPLCFRPHLGTIAGSCCAECSEDNRRAVAIRIAKGDEADRIIENAVIEAEGSYFACEWQHTVGNGLDEPLEVVASGYSAHARREDAAIAAAWHRQQGRSVAVEGPFPFPLPA